MTSCKFHVKRFFHTLLVLFILFSLSILVFSFMNLIVADVYEGLAKWFPDKIPVYNRILEEDGYFRIHAILDAITALPTFFVVGYLAVLLDPSKRHLFFKETHGMVTFREGLSYYCKRFLASDIFAAIVLSALFSLLAFAVPVFSYIPKYSDPAENGIVTLARTLMEPITALYAEAGFGLCTLGVAVSTILGGLASIPHSVLHYRGDALAHTLE